ncbi:PepSY-associated TM helix domain-containing protein [Chitinophaga nivalis]|uniref:PepSY domain-containing protein n=1 Tax=Chitinophaga nivalis TaxID=2991709 RepID=A0ABT3IMQ2_9BACT|nr:PepSY-associated TM helix domain-containing protein [Chitinophaga nivalis]MCW3465074.1 PepSY domain-containing protein [Chitinophaga nivalis]MCW3485234.1 PepSY domain-containing protein [Chitinophaga nivalis]
MIKRFKKITGQLHLWLGLASGLVVFIVTVTGSMLVFEKELDPLINKDRYFVAHQPGEARLSLDSLLRQVARAQPALQVTRLEIETHDPDRPLMLLATRKKELYRMAVDPYTAKVVSVIPEDKRFFSIIVHLHRYLLAGKTGKAITGVSCIIFICLIISGLILWWPKKWKGLKQRLSIKNSGNRKRFIWDLHAVGGFYIHALILVIALTGLTWSYKWFNNGIFLVMDGKPPAANKAPANRVMQAAGDGFYESLYNKANVALPYNGRVTLLIPAGDSTAVTVSKENHEAAVPNVVDFLYYEKGTGTLLKAMPYAKQTAGMKVRRMIYPIHTGSIFGWPTKLLAFFSCLFAASLPVTGLLVWLNRRKKKTKSVPPRKAANLAVAPIPRPVE